MRERNEAAGEMEKEGKKESMSQERKRNRRGMKEKEEKLGSRYSKRKCGRKGKIGRWISGKEK